MIIKLGDPFKGFINKKYPNGSITQIFGVNPRAYASMGMNGHSGEDYYPMGLPNAEQTELLSVVDGYVYEVKNNPIGYGRYVRVWSEWDENGECLDTIYGHMSEIKVDLGQKVKMGDPLGIIGNTGFVISSTGEGPTIQTVTYWGNAPAHKGIHEHLGVRIAQKIDDSNTRIKDYNNGFFGYFNHNPYFISNKNDMLKLYLDTKTNKQYIEGIDNVKHWIFNLTILETFHSMGIVNKNTPISVNGISGIIGKPIAIIDDIIQNI